ncbi:MAG: hypothetical protein K0R81_334 [Microbacterium sp.]|nr:hypothetical protein [Microbacterium sp.]
MSPFWGTYFPPTTWAYFPSRLSCQGDRKVTILVTVSVDAGDQSDAILGITRVSRRRPRVSRRRGTFGPPPAKAPENEHRGPTSRFPPVLPRLSPRGARGTSPPGTPGGLPLHHAVGRSGPDRAGGRHPGVDPHHDRSAVVAPALQPARDVPRRVGRAVQQHAQGRRRARRRLRRAGAWRTAPTRIPSGSTGSRDGRSPVPHRDRGQPRARGLRAPEQQQGPARQGRRHDGARFRRPVDHDARADAPPEPPPRDLDRSRLRVPVRRSVAVRHRHDQPRALRGDRLRRDVRLVRDLHVDAVPGGRRRRGCGGAGPGER